MNLKRQKTLPSIHTKATASQSLMSVVRSPSQTIYRKPTNILSRIGHNERQWLSRRGKKSSIMFSSQMLQKLRTYFNDLDLDESGAIGQQQLEDPLITLGFCDTKAEVEDLIKQVDLDGSNEIEFSQFLEIFRKIKNGKYTNPNEAKKYQLFLKIFSEKSNKNLQKDVCYKVAISELRRKKLLKAIIKQHCSDKQESMKFLRKVQKQFQQTPQIREELREKKEQTNYFLYKLK